MYGMLYLIFKLRKRKRGGAFLPPRAPPPAETDNDFLTLAKIGLNIKVSYFYETTSVFSSENDPKNRLIFRCIFTTGDSKNIHLEKILPTQPQYCVLY